MIQIIAEGVHKSCFAVVKFCAKWLLLPLIIVANLFSPVHPNDAAMAACSEMGIVVPKSLNGNINGAVCDQIQLKYVAGLPGADVVESLAVRHSGHMEDADLASMAGVKSVTLPQAVDGIEPSLRSLPNLKLISAPADVIEGFDLDQFSGELSSLMIGSDQNRLDATWLLGYPGIDFAVFEMADPEAAVITLDGKSFTMDDIKDKPLEVKKSDGSSFKFIIWERTGGDLGAFALKDLYADNLGTDHIRLYKR